MGKAILISIRPQWCELIASGKKTVEVRKTRPKTDTPFKCYIYCTKGIKPIYDDDGCLCGFLGKDGYLVNGKVIGEFTCNEIDRYAKYGFYHFGQVSEKSRYMKSSPGGYPATEIQYYPLQLTPEELEDYGGGKPLYGWHISDLVMYDEPKQLSEFYKWWGDADIRPCQNGKGCNFAFYDYGENCEACAVDYDGTDCPFIKVTRPPQSWCYVEELDG